MYLKHVVIFIIASHSFLFSQTAKYASSKTKELLAKVIKAHGGMEAWNKAKTFSFTHILTFGEPLAAEWGISEEMTEIKSLKTYQWWPLEKAYLGFDGKKTWVSKNFNGFSFPKMQVNTFYKTLSLPWTIDNMPYIIAEPAKGKLTKDSTQYLTIKINFDAKTGESPDRYYKLFIDPKTYLIKAIEYSVTYGAFLDLLNLPKDQKFYGPVTHVIFEYTTVNGLIFPKKYDTIGEDGNRYGSHVAYNYSLDLKFDDSKMTMPKDAVIDSSSNIRKK